MSNDITIKKSTYNKFIIGLVTSLIVAAFFGGYILGTHSETKTITTQSTYQAIPSHTFAQPNSLPNPQTKMAISVTNGHMIGNSTAPITLIEFSDFGCPFCGKFFSDTLPDIEKNYVETGKVRFVFKNFPLGNIHPNAVTAAISAECANEQGAFWKYHDILFKNQVGWAQINSTDASKIFKQYASKLGLDENQFSSCLDSGKYTDKITKDEQDGTSYGVDGTPTFFIGNDKIGYMQIGGAQPLLVFQQEIDSELKSTR
jgi:protein-disulfide isomerase